MIIYKHIRSTRKMRLRCKKKLYNFYRCNNNIEVYLTIIFKVKTWKKKSIRALWGFYLLYFKLYICITPILLKLFWRINKKQQMVLKNVFWAINFILKQENGFQIYLKYFFFLILWILTIYNRYQMVLKCAILFYYNSSILVCLYLS